MPRALAVGGKVRAHAQRLPAAAEIDAEAGPHVVEDQRRVVAVRQRPDGVGKVTGGQFLIVPSIVAECRNEDAGQVVDRLLGGGVERGDVVVDVVDLVGAVLRRRPAGPRRTPGRGTVIGALGHQDLAPRSLGARHHRAGGGGVGAVLGEHRPVGRRDGLHHLLRQLHQHLAGTVGDAHACALGAGGSVCLRVAVAQDHRAERAHEVEIFVAVHITKPGALGFGEELREPLGQARRVHVAPHAARNDPASALSERDIFGQRSDSI